MARKRRNIQAGCCYHTMLRGNSKQDIFHDNQDFTRFCLLLQYASEKHDLQIHAFCLMKNHVHLVMQPQRQSLSEGMHALAFRYAQYYNNKYSRVGYLYQGRYKAVLVQSGNYLRHLARYVHLNPVRAQIVRFPEEYFWSSYSMYIGRHDCNWINTTLILDAFGKTTQDSLEKFIRYTLMDELDVKNEAIAIRNSLHTGAYGESAFLEKWLPMIRGELVRPRSAGVISNRVSIEAIVEAVCKKVGMSLFEIRSEKRSKDHISARTLAVCLTQKLNAGSMKALGEHILRDPTSLAKLARKNSDDAEFQGLLNGLAASFLELGV